MTAKVILSMDSVTQEFYDFIRRGEEGLNKGHPFLVPALNENIGGILKGFYYLIIGKSGSGKSTLLYDQFIFNLIDLVYRGILKEDDIEIVLYSFEISRVNIMAKAAVRFLHKYEKVITDVKQITGARGKAPKELYELIYSDRLGNYLALVNRLTSVITASNPREMREFIRERCIKQSDIIGKDPEGKDVYRFKNKNKLFMIAIDHASLTNLLPGTKLKESVDGLSKHVLVEARNTFGVTSVLVQQVTPSNENVKKIIHGHADARDTKNTYQDCDICMAIGSPYGEKYDTVHYKGGVYNIRPKDSNNFTGLKDRMRLIGIEKDRYGSSNIRYATGFVGESGIFTELADPNDIDYDFWENIKKTHS